MNPPDLGAAQRTLWYADIRGFTAIADSMPGAEVIALLDEVFEALAAPLRPCGGQVLKFIGDACPPPIALSVPPSTAKTEIAHYKTTVPILHAATKANATMITQP